MLTFQQLYEDAQEQLQDTSAATLVLIKRALNQGMQKFGAILNREWRHDERTFSTTADQQFYQMPENCIRPKSVVITIGNVDYPLQECADEETWQALNMRTETNDVPEFYYVKGSDLFGIWPIPSSSNDDAGVIAYEPRMRRMSADDYTTGSVAVVTNSQGVVGSGTTFTAQMVGRTLLVEDQGDQDGIGYKVVAFTDTTHITVENFYNGLSGSGKTYRIGEVPDIPDEYHESLIDYALYRVYRRRKDRGMANDAKAAFDEAIMQCESSYSSSSSSQYIPPRPRLHSGYVHQRRDYSVSA